VNISRGVFFGIMVTLCAVPALSQRGRGGGGGGNNAEATEFQDFLEESIPLRQIQLGETFISAHRNSTFRPQVDQLLAEAYAKAQNWAGVMTTAERLHRELSGGQPQPKNPVYISAMLAALRTSSLTKALEFGDWVMTGDPNDINPYQVLATAIPEMLPQDSAQRKAALSQAMDYAKKGIALQRPQRVNEAAWDGAQTKLHFALAFVYLNLDQFQESIAEYESVLKTHPNDALAQYRLGMAYFFTMQDLVPSFTTAAKAVEDALDAKADTTQLKQLAEKRDSTAVSIMDARDNAVDALARAVAIGLATNHPVTQPAREQLEPLFKNQSPDAAAGALDQLLEKKKTELGL